MWRVGRANKNKDDIIDFPLELVCKGQYFLSSPDWTLCVITFIILFFFFTFTLALLHQSGQSYQVNFRELYVNALALSEKIPKWHKTSLFLLYLRNYQH